MTEQSIPISLMEDMRKLGRSLSDKGMIEYSVTTGTINWVNDFVLDKTGYTLEQIQKLSIFEIVPEQFHGKMQDSIAIIAKSKEPGSSIWPGKSSLNQITWWYVLQANTQYPIRWAQCDYIQTTENTGTAYTFMCIQMDTTNNYGRLHQKVNELDRWAHIKIDELSYKQGVIEEFIKKDLNPTFESAKEAAESAKRASTIADETKKSLDEFKAEFKKELKSVNDKAEEHTGEILKLISTDVVHSKRISAFEQHVKMTTDLAIKSITLQANKAGKGLSKKVTIPVSITAAIVTIVQYLIQNWPF